MTLPAGVSASIGGVSASQADSFKQLGMALLAAIAIVFVVMVATFRSIVQPLILLISIPFAATGAFTLLLATDTALGVPSLLIQAHARQRVHRVAQHGLGVPLQIPRLA